MKNTIIHTGLLYIPEIQEYIKQKKFQELKELIKGIHPIDLAECIANLKQEEKIIVFELLPTSRMIEVFEELPYADQKILVEKMKEETITDILGDMEMPSMKKLFHKAPEKIRKKLYSLLNKEKIETIKKIIKYPKNTAGSIMHTDYITLNPNQTSKAALERIQAVARLHRAENLYVFYVTDENNKLLGGVTLRKLISSPPHIKIQEIMSKTTLIEIQPKKDLGYVTHLFEKYDLVAAPVVNEKKELLGVIIVDDIIDMLRKTTLAQIHGLGKVSISHVGVETRYSDMTSPIELVKKRVFWLFLLVILGYLGSSVIKLHKEALTAIVALSFFIPMLCDTGGNAGCQTVTTIIRSLATGDINPKNVLKVIGYEAISGLIMGILVGMVGFLRALLLVEGNILLSFVVGLSVFCVVVVAILTGMALPFLAKLIRVDPAVLSAPLITTVVDIVGLVVYFKIASIFLPILKKI